MAFRSLLERIVDHRYWTDGRTWRVDLGPLNRKRSIALLLSRHRNLPSQITDDLPNFFRRGERKVSSPFSRIRSSRCSPALHCQTVYCTGPSASHYCLASGRDGVSASILVAMTKSLR